MLAHGTWFVCFLLVGNTANFGQGQENNQKTFTDGLLIPDAKITDEGRNYFITLERTRKLSAFYEGSRMKRASYAFYEADTAPLLVETFEARTVNPKTSVSLHCAARGRPTPSISWLHDGASVASSRSRQETTESGLVRSTLSLGSVAPVDGGLYTCIAQTASAPPTVHQARIAVTGPPVVRPMANRTLLAGERLVLPCPVGGHPIESVEWLKDGQPIPASERVQTFPNNTLVVNALEPELDRGTYTCKASGPRGLKDEKSLVVTVRVPPKIIPFESMRLRQGSAGVLTCAVNRGEPPLEISWLKDGEPLAPELGLSLQVHALFSLLAFANVDRRHAANYTCSVRNAAGATAHSARVVVDVPPRWLVEPSNSSVIQGQSTTLDCQAEGEPSPVISWKRAAGSELEPIFNSHTTVLHPNGTLGLRDLVNDSFFVCQASNNIGPALSKLVAVKVHVPPYFDDSPKVRTVQLKKSLEVVCKARGDGPLTVVWARDSLVLTNKSSTSGHGKRFSVRNQAVSGGVDATLILSHARRNDSGLYACVARNPYGDKETVHQIVVQEAPGAPSGLELARNGPRVIQLRWTEPFNGHATIVGYLVQYRLDSEEGWQNSSQAATGPRADVNSLQPFSKYVFRVQAVNSVGPGDFSPSIFVTTEEEAPGGPPTDVQAVATGPNSIKVSWKPPPVAVWHGKVRGYYIGYREVGSDQPAMFKTVELEGAGPLEAHLTNLRRAALYRVSVQAFNGKGAGPRSDPKDVHTLADVPPTAPHLSVTTTTYNTITLSWSQKRNFDSPVTECTLYRRKDYGTWTDSAVLAQDGSVTVPDLECGTRYFFYMVCHNSVGRSEPSETLAVRTAGGAPVSPSKEEFLQCDATSASLNLQAWQGSGCPISRFSLRLRRRNSAHWSPVAPVNRSRHTLQGLTPGTPYELQVTAFNSAGATEARYDFFTPNLTSALEGEDRLANALEPALDSAGLSFAEVGILVPVVTAFIMVLLVVGVGCFLCRRRQHRGHSCSEADGELYPSKSRQVLELSVKEAPASRLEEGAVRTRPLSTVVVPFPGISGGGEEPPGETYAAPYDPLPDYSLRPGERVQTLTRRPRQEYRLEDYIARQSHPVDPQRAYEALKTGPDQLDYEAYWQNDM